MMSRDEFEDLMDYATEEPYSFLHVNNQCTDPHMRFRKNWDEVLRLNNVDHHDD